MEQKLQLIIRQINSIMGDEANFLCVLTDKENLGVTALQGNPSLLAETLFYLIHQKQLPLSENVYLLIKSIVLNLIRNKTEIGIDLMKEVTWEIAAQYGK